MEFAECGNSIRIFSYSIWDSVTRRGKCMWPSRIWTAKAGSPMWDISHWTIFSFCVFWWSWLPFHGSSSNKMAHLCSFCWFQLLCGRFLIFWRIAAWCICCSSSLLWINISLCVALGLLRLSLSSFSYGSEYWSHISLFKGRFPYKNFIKVCAFLLTSSTRSRTIDQNSNGGRFWAVSKEERNYDVNGRRRQ